MIEKNTLPGVDEYFQHMVKELNVECEDLNNRQGGGAGGQAGQNGQAGVTGGGTAKKAKASGGGGGVEPQVQRGSAPPGVGGGRRPVSGRGECFSVYRSAFFGPKSLRMSENAEIQNRNHS